MCVFIPYTSLKYVNVPFENTVYEYASIYVFLYDVSVR